MAHINSNKTNDIAQSGAEEDLLKTIHIPKNLNMIG
jgi:hypothetical protein